MPYLDCPHCRLTVYSAARYSSVDECPRCATLLGLEPRPLFPLVDRVIATQGEQDHGSPASPRPSAR